MTGLQRPTVIISGGTKGLGRALSVEFGRAGYRVLALYHSDAQAAAELDRLMSEMGIQGRSLRHDVRQDNRDSELWTAAEISEASALTLIHNAAAPFTPTPLHLLGDDDFRQAFEVAVMGCWHLVRGALRPMVSHGGGTVVSILTRALTPPPPKGFTAYRAAKAAQSAFMESLAAEYGARGIRTFSVSPGFMATAMTEEWHPNLIDAASDGGASDPAGVAARVRRLVEDDETPGQGEIHDA